MTLAEARPHTRKWIFSVDDHTFEGPGTFTERVPKAMVGDVPSIVDHNGGDAWLIDGEPVPITVGDGMASWEVADRPSIEERHVSQGAGSAVFPGYKLHVETSEMAAVPRTSEERRRRGIVRVEEDFRPGVYDIDARVKDMDADGVWASVLIPSITFGFAGQRFSLMKDPEVGLACARAYNDWLDEEIASVHPERFVCSQVPWLRDPVVAAAEVRRNAARGFTAVLFPENPERFGFPSIHSSHWDPFFEACEETHTILNLHLGSGLKAQAVSTDSPVQVAKSSFIVNPALSAVDWIFSQVFIRFPDLKCALTEGGIDFVPLVYGRLSTLWDDSLGSGWTADIRPDEVLLRNFWYAALFDVGAYLFIDKHCPTHGMVETDFPHADTFWPDSHAHLTDRLSDLSAEGQDRFLFENAAALYRKQVPQVGEARS
jgi:predicted TIM-barrel fold metal-dependent hydrolase